MSSWLMYLWFVYDRSYHFIMFIFESLVVIYAIFRAIVFLAVLEDSNESNTNSKLDYKKFARSIWIMAIVLSLLQLVPNRNQLLLIWGIPKLTHNETVINLSEKSWRYLDNYLDREIKKLRAELSKHNMNKK